MTPDAGAVLGSLPPRLRQELTTAFDNIVVHYRAGRWEPSELNGGKFCEVVHTVLRGYVDGAYPQRASKPRNMVTACQALESATNVPRSIRIQIPRMLIALYEIRNNRNVGHVGGDVDPNHMDAVCVLSMSRWILAELVRVLHEVSIEDATALVEALTERDIATVWEVSGKRRVLDPTLAARDATLLLLYSSAGEVAVRDLIAWLEYRNSSRFRTQLLAELHRARLVEFDQSTDAVELSPLGSRYVEENLDLHVA